MKHFISLLMSAVLLASCAKKDPVQTIVDQQKEHFEQVLDYSYYNLEQTQEVVLLEKEIHSCIVALESVGQTHHSQIGKCEAERNYWRLATFGLLLLIGLYVGRKLMIR